ncbi:lipoyl(octanoyl) transferase LipB [Microlunatus speluncae]|uniref:lipoyl(octanoyl) transferase LipB n=1 Tax=Microlunatus speluncae TaxID=2594267 RepID=UPI0012660B75|nr:lipoyl(octanoyl) transferase LipB [Microlunatus speluncae]
MTLDVRLLGLGSKLIDYSEAWLVQQEVHEQVVAGRLPDTLLLLEHDSVYTAGKRTEPTERPTDGTPVIDVDRGGKITWHGPGQLVGYPIVRLPEQIKVVDYVRRLEEALIRSVAEFGITAGRVPGRSGAWLAADDHHPERKIGAIGVRVAGGVTMHGFALNVSPELTAYSKIIPCGIVDAGVTSMAAELPYPPSLLEVAAVVVTKLEDLLDFEAYVPAPDLAGRAGVRYGLTVSGQ